MLFLFSIRSSVIALALSIYSAASAQTVAIPDTIPVRSELKGGSWSLQFGLKQDLVLTSFQGAIISAKLHTSDRRAIRFGLTAFGDVAESNQNQGPASTPNSSRSNGQSISVNAQYLLYPYSTSSVIFVFGFGPQLGVSRSTSSFRASQNLSKNTNTSFSGGMSGSWGAEWFFKPGLSLLAEYGVSMSYSRYKSTRTTESVDTFGGINILVSERNSVSSRTRFGHSALKFGVSFYF